MDNLSQNSQEHEIINKDYNVDHLDEGYDIYALFCFQEVPIAMIEDILDGSARHSMREYHYWLADQYSTLPQSEEKEDEEDEEEEEERDEEAEEAEGTIPPLPRNWRSPFLGSTIEAAFEHVKNAPTGDLLNRKHILVLDKKPFEEKHMLRVYRMEGPAPEFAEELNLNIQPGDITDVGGDAYTIVEALMGYDRGTGSSKFHVKDWRSRGLPFNR